MRRWLITAAIAALVAGANASRPICAQAPDAADPVKIFNEAQDVHEKGDLKGAILLYDKALQLMPQFPEAAYQRGVAELSLGNTNEAMSSFQTAIAARPAWTLPKTALASLLIRLGKRTEAGDLLKQVLDVEPQDPAALLSLVDLELQSPSPQAEREKLLASITTLSENSNASARIWSARSAVEASLGQTAASRRSLQKALAIDPADRAALFQAADAALSAGDVDKAAEFAARLNTHPDESTLLLNARILAADGKIAEASAVLQRLPPDYGPASDLRGKIKGLTETDPSQLETQLAASPRDAALLGRLCWMFRRADPQKALDYCRRASEADPSNAAPAIGFGAALVQAKRFDDAARVLQRILTVAPDNSTAHANLATALFQLKRFPEAREQYEWLSNADPKAAAPYLFLGIVHDQLGEYPDAAASYEQYLKLADPATNGLDIEKVKLRLPQLQRSIKEGKGKKGP